MTSLVTLSRGIGKEDLVVAYKQAAAYRALKFNGSVLNPSEMCADLVLNLEIHIGFSNQLLKSLKQSGAVPMWSYKNCVRRMLPFAVISQIANNC